MKNLDNYMLIHQGRYENIYCDMVRHVITDGGYMMPPRATSDVNFIKQPTKCTCTEKEKEDALKFKDFLL